MLLNLRNLCLPRFQRTLRLLHKVQRFLPKRSLDAFGTSPDRISAILVINLDRQPLRWHRVQKELDRFSSYDGCHLIELTKRISAVDARNFRDIAPSADVDPHYRMADQLFVEPDARLEYCFGPDEPITMSPQEIAVARSHIEVWKRIARGDNQYVLVLEDDACFANGAARVIELGWSEAIGVAGGKGAPELIYLSYVDAGKTAQRMAHSANLFRPIRGLWGLSGYVLSRRGATNLLHLMPVVGPVDLWINGRFADLNVLALSRPAILQNPEAGSDNAYSILPYLSRAGIVDRIHRLVAPRANLNGVVIAWDPSGACDMLGMALSMLGYRVCSGLKQIPESELRALLSGRETAFNAYVDAEFDELEIAELLFVQPNVKFMIGPDSTFGRRMYDIIKRIVNLKGEQSSSKKNILELEKVHNRSWQSLCGFLGQTVPNAPLPCGMERSIGLFRPEREVNWHDSFPNLKTDEFDVSPWIRPNAFGWTGMGIDTTKECVQPIGHAILRWTMSRPSEALRPLSDTFPGNLAVFHPDNIVYDQRGTTLLCVDKASVVRRFRSGSLGSKDPHLYGRFEVEMKAARGPGLVTGFFLHRYQPRQEIDIEILGNNPTRMLVNVFFNPGDPGTDFSFGYRGTPQLVDLGFDASVEFHNYTIEWTFDRIWWLVDGRVVHKRARWDPTPIPHLPLHVHVNLWISRSVQLAGRIREYSLPAKSTFRNMSIYSLCED